jgi:hypothetical protein
MDNHSGNVSLGFDGPGIANQPPQIFGGLNPDGSPAQPVLSGPLFQDYGDVGSADDNDPKRRRIARVRATAEHYMTGCASMLIVRY